MAQIQSSHGGWLRRFYDWTLAWANKPQAQVALFFIALIEASIFPIPPDILLLAMALSQPELSLRFAFLATLGSTIGAVVGYFIGMMLFVAIAEPILNFYHMMSQFEHVQALFTEYGLWIVIAAGFSPIPFKVVTIAAGAFDLSFIGFIMAALLSRGARFYLEAVVMRWGGERLRLWVEKYFEWLTMAVIALVGCGFFVLWMFN